MEKPPATNFENLRMREKIEAGPFAYVIHLHVANPTGDWLGPVLADWQRMWGAAPAFERDDALVALHFVTGQKISFVHPDLAQTTPAPGMVIYGTVPWEQEACIFRLGVLSTLLCRRFNLKVIEILFQGKIILGKT